MTSHRNRNGPTDVATHLVTRFLGPGTPGTRGQEWYVPAGTVTSSPWRLSDGGATVTFTADNGRRAVLPIPLPAPTASARRPPRAVPPEGFGMLMGALRRAGDREHVVTALRWYASLGNGPDRDFRGYIADGLGIMYQGSWETIPDQHGCLVLRDREGHAGATEDAPLAWPAAALVPAYRGDLTALWPHLT